jgi:purine-cytosine permease-like protein
MDETEQNESGRTRTIRLLGREITMPQSRLLRIVIGGLLVFFGLFGFLPVLGFWMIPVGLIVLSYEFATVRRWRRRFEVWWAERRGRRRARDRQQFDESDRR